MKSGNANAGNVAHVRRLAKRGRQHQAENVRNGVALREAWGFDALAEFYQEEGLLMAVNYVWGCLKRPKAGFCTQMAQGLGLGGQGKTALRYVLQKLLQESLHLHDWKVPDWPKQEDFPGFDSYNAETLRYHERLGREFRQIIDRWEAILDGRDPNEPGKSAEIIKGPWRPPSRPRLSDKEERHT
jgi:hypothetical protein